MDIIILVIAFVMWLGLIALIREHRRAYWGLFAVAIQLAVAQQLSADQTITYGTTTIAADSTLWLIVVVWIFITLIWTMKESRKPT